MNTMVFLLGNTELRQTIWDVSSVHYSEKQNLLTIRIDTTKNEYAVNQMTLQSVGKSLSEYLVQNGLLESSTAVHFLLKKHTYTS